MGWGALLDEVVRRGRSGEVTSEPGLTHYEAVLLQKVGKELSRQREQHSGRK